MSYNPQNPIIVQGDRSVLLEVDNAFYQDARDVLARFAELEKSPEYVHTHRITPLSLWNAASAGLSAAAILEGLGRYSKYPVPDNVRVDIEDYISRYGRVKLIRRNGDLLLVSDDKALIAELVRHKLLVPYPALPARTGTHPAQPLWVATDQSRNRHTHAVAARSVSLLGPGAPQRCGPGPDGLYRQKLAQDNQPGSIGA